jgi:23S rRNA (uracil1939-C5)-methyltransferase
MKKPPFRGFFNGGVVRQAQAWLIAFMKDIPVTISHIGASGDGVGTYEEKSVYVPKTAPGDAGIIRVKKENAEGIFGKMVRLEAASAVRVPAPCPHFEHCGGCALQHVNENFYRDWKIGKVKAALARAEINVGAWEEPVFLPAATRRRTTIAAFKNGKDVRFGYFAPGTHDIIDVKTCLVVEPVLEDKMLQLKALITPLIPERKAVDIMIQHAGGAFDMVLTGPWKDKKGFTLEQHEALAAIMETLDIARVSLKEKEFSPPEILLSRSPVLKQFGAVHVALPPGTFLQASLEGERTLGDLVVNYAGDAKNIADLFAGCGTFAGALLAAGASVHAVDGDKAAMAALGMVKHQKLTSAHRDLFKNPLTAAELKAYDCAVFDPPRAGAASQAEMLAWSDVGRVIGVSCNPVSFARDAKTLQDGGYTLKSLTIIDQFVWSSHVEVAGLFTR